MRRASETNIPDSARLSSLLTKSSDKALNGISPSSPIMQLSPLSGSRSDEDGPPDGIDFEFSYKHPESQSTTSLSSDLRDNPASSFSAGTMSPTAPFTFSPDPNMGGFPMDHLRGNDFQHREKRSNTFPSLNIDYANHVSSAAEPMTPRHPPSSTAPSSALESPQHEFQVAPFGINTNLSSPPQALRQSNSNPSMNRSSGTPITTTVNTSTSSESSPVSPSQEDARRAAQTLLNYISAAGNFDRGDYMTIVQLTKKLKINQHQANRSSIGGLSRIPEGDHEALPTLVQAKMETT